MSAAQTAAALASHGVDLVYENNGRRLLFRLLKQVAHTAGAHAHIHFHKVRAGDGQKRHVRLAGHGLGQQGLAGARRANQQHALGDVGAQLQILVRIPQELHDLLQLLLFLVGAGHLVKGHPILAPSGHLHPRLAEFGHLVLRSRIAAAGHAPHKIDNEYKADDPQHIGQQRAHPVGGVDEILLLHKAALHLLLHQPVHIRVKRLHAADGAGNCGIILQLRRQLVAGDGEGLHLFLAEIAAHVAVGHGAAAGAHVPHHRHNKHHQQQNQQNAAGSNSSLRHRSISFL